MYVFRITKNLPVGLALALAPCLGGCNGALIGNVVVLGVTVGIFYGTLSLGRTGLGGSSAATRSAEQSSTRPPRS